MEKRVIKELADFVMYTAATTIFICMAVAYIVVDKYAAAVIPGSAGVFWLIGVLQRYKDLVKESETEEKEEIEQ